MADIRKFRFEDIREFKDLSKDGSTFVVVKPVKPISEDDPNLDFVSFDPQAAQALAAIWAAKTGEVDLEVRPPKEGKKSPTLHWPRKGGGGGGFRGKSDAELAQDARIAALDQAVKVLTCSPSLWGVPLEQVPEHILKTAKQFLPFIQGGGQPARAAPKPLAEKTAGKPGVVHLNEKQIKYLLDQGAKRGLDEAELLAIGRNTADIDPFKKALSEYTEAEARHLYEAIKDKPVTAAAKG